MAEMVTVDIRLLGGLEVVKNEQVITLRGQRAPAALAVLALHPGQPVTTTQLIQALWGAEIPRAAKESVHVFIHQLRKALEPELITTQGASYRLQVQPEQVDVVRFQRLAARARAARDRGGLEDAWELFGQALRVWRGAALADFVTEPFAASARARLEDRRLAAVEEQVRVGLDLGRHTELAGELDALTAQHPHREGLWELLLLARYRAGRQAQALEAYQDARRALARQPGQQPGARLEELQRAILAQDPSLEQRPRSPDHLRAVPADHRPPRPQPNAHTVVPQPEAIPQLRASATPAQRNLRPAPAAPSATRRPEERKLVTALVLSVSSTDSKAPNDPEETRACTARLLQQMTERIGHYGGIVHAVVGERLLAIFGAERSHTDDPERAVRAALEILEGLQHTDRGGLAVLRAGVATGEVVVTHSDQTDDGCQVTVAGDALNAAAGLEAHAEVGTVVVGSGTYLTTRRVIDYRPLAQTSTLEQALGPMAWQALAPRGRTGAHLTDRAAAPLIERDRELGMLTDVFGRFLRDRQPQMLTLISEPGLGKSRLVAELGRLIDQAPELIGWRVGYSRPYDQGALGALVEIVKAQVGVLDGDDAQTAERKFHQAAEAAEAAEPEPVAESLRALLGAAVQPSSQRQRLFADWTRFLAAVAEQRPLVVVFEDLQWADDALLEFIAELPELAGSVPLLVVCTGRPEFMSRRARWGGGQRNTVTLSLSPLTQVGAGRLLDGLLDQRQERLPEPTREALLAASGGNPLYVEEYARMLAEQPTAADADLPIPASVQQVIAARIDTLPSQDKRLLQDAAVIGQTGWVGALAAVSGQDRDEVGAGLQRLQRHEFLRRVRASSVAGDTEFTFRHALIREVAYGQLLRAERLDRHQRIAGWVESLNPGPGVRVELLAHHYTRALDLARAAGQPDQALAERARQVFRRAGDRAVAIGSLAAAARAYQAALELWPADDPARPELMLRLGQAMVFGANAAEEPHTETREAAVGVGRQDSDDEAEALLSRLELDHTDLAAVEPQTEDLASRTGDGNSAAPTPDPATVTALGARAFSLVLTCRYEKAITTARQAAALAEQLGLFAEQGNGLHLAGEARILAGDIDGWAEVEQGLELMDVHRSWLRVLARYGHTQALWWYGDLDRCATALAAGRQVADNEDAAGAPWFSAVGAALDYAAGRWDAMEAVVDRALAERTTPVRPAIWQRILRGKVRLARGQVDGALADAQTAFQTADTSDIRFRQVALALQGRCLLAAERREAAVACLEDLLAEQRKQPAESCATTDEAVLMLDLDYPAAALPDGLPPTRWHQAVRTLVSRDFHRAAELLTAIGSTADAAQATARLRTG